MKLESNHIVCGRGQSNYNNEGNKIFRQVVARRLPLYMDENTGRTAKTKLVNETACKFVQMKMFFVKRSICDRHWVKLSADEARAKVAHVFRDASRQALRGSAKKSKSSCARIIPATSDSDESCSLLPSAVGTGLATRSGSDLNNMVNSSSDSQVKGRKGIDSASSIAETVARSNDDVSSEKPQVPKTIDCEGSLFSHTLSEFDFSDAMKNELNDLRILRYSTHNSLILRHIIPRVEKWGALELNDVCSLSNVEHLDDLRSLTADCSDFEMDLDSFPSESSTF